MAPTLPSVSYFTEYADQSKSVPADEPCTECEEFVFPEDLSTLSVEELNDLNEKAVAAFDAIYGDGTTFAQSDVDALTELSKGIEALQVELAARAQQAAELAAQASELASKVKGGGDQPAADAAPAADQAAPAAAPAEATVAAAAPQQIRVNLSSVTRRTPAPAPVAEPRFSSMRDVVSAAGDLNIIPAGQGVNWDEIGQIVAHRLQGFNLNTYQAAANSGRHLSQQFAVATIRKPIPDDLMIQTNDPAEADRVIAHAVSESRLKGGSLVASGGWCAPSETLYDLIEMETRDGLYSLPEVGVARGGIRRTPGPNFADIFNAVGFSFTEQNDIDGKYALDASGNPIVGDKPCYKVDCPDWAEVRLAVAGLCISAGLLQSRAFPEMLARVTRGALIAHDHKMAARLINAVVAGSTAVAMPMPQQGTIAPLLTAIELQVEHMRYTNRLAHGTTVEAVFPFWIRGAIRSDLSRRNGVDMLSVSDAQIQSWFAERGVAAQFVYNWQDINTTTAANFTSWPATVKFLLYPAGGWVRGTSDIITVDTLYDSVLLAQNDFTALFTEEGWLVDKRTHDSRVVTVPVCSDGSTAAGVDFMCDGSTQNSSTLVYGTTTTTTTA